MAHSSRRRSLPPRAFGQKAELLLLAKNWSAQLDGKEHHRRAALWRAERAGQSAGSLFENVLTVMSRSRSSTSPDDE